MKALLILTLLMPTLAKASEVSCLAQIMWSEVQGESLSGVASVGSAALNALNKTCASYPALHISAHHSINPPKTKR